MSFLRGALRIHTDPDTRFSCRFPVLFVLRKGVKDDMVADLRQLFHILRFVSRREDMVFLSHFFPAKARLIQPARRCPADILSDQRIQVVHGKRFLRQKHMAARLLFQIF